MPPAPASARLRCRFGWVSRDRYMLELEKQYPQYQLAKHKGYPTKLHYELIAQYGIQPFYRRSFLKKQGYWPESSK